MVEHPMESSCSCGPTSTTASASLNELMERTAGKRLLSVFLAARLAVRCGDEHDPLRSSRSPLGVGAAAAGGFDPRLAGGDLVDGARGHGHGHGHGHPSPPGPGAFSDPARGAFSPADFFKESELLVAQDMLLDMGLPSSPREAPRDARALVESRSANSVGAASSPSPRGRGGQPSPGHRGQEGQTFHNSL